MASRAAAKSSKWFSDPSTYPLIACIAAGSLMCVSFGARHLTKSPDVKWDRSTRKDKVLVTKDQTQWMAHRKAFKNLSENVINTSKKD